MIDNSEQIKSLMDFSIDGTFFMLSVYRRKKDQPEIDGQKSDNILIKDYFIKSLEDFDKKYPEIKSLCDYFNARAYIRLNRCFYDKVAMETLAIIVEYMQKGNLHNVKAAYTTACGRRCYDPEKKWVIDIDEDVDEWRVEQIIQSSKSGFDNNIIAKIPTVNGVHFITHPFDKRTLDWEFPDIVHKSNPTLLYYKK